MQLVLKNHQGTIFSIHFQKAHVKAAVETTYLLRSQLFLHLKKNAGPKKNPLETGIFLAEKQRLPSYVASKKLTGIRLYKVGPCQVVKSRVKNIILLIMEWIFTPSYPFISQHYRGYNFIILLSTTSRGPILIYLFIHLFIYLFIYYFFLAAYFLRGVPPSGWLCAPGCNPQCVRAGVFGRFFLGVLAYNHWSRWWFETFFIFTLIWGNDPI